MPGFSETLEKTITLNIVVGLFKYVKLPRFSHSITQSEVENAILTIVCGANRTKAGTKSSCCTRRNDADWFNDLAGFYVVKKVLE